jgi:tRNA(Ile)-lysidine synthase
MMEELIHGASDKINLAFEDIVEVSDWLVESASSQFETLKLSPSKLKIKNDIAPVILREIMSQWLIELGLVKFQNRKNIQQLVGLYHSASGAKVQFSSYTFLKQFETVEFFVNNPDKKDTDVIERQSLKREEIITFAGERVMLTQSPEKHFFRQGYWLEADLELENLFLAKRFPGAIFSPKTGGGSKKLKKWLIEKKIPVTEREKLICLYSGDEALWVINHEVSMKLDRNKKNSSWYVGVLDLSH